MVKIMSSRTPPAALCQVSAGMTRNTTVSEIQPLVHCIEKEGVAAFRTSLNMAQVRQLLWA